MKTLLALTKDLFFTGKLNAAIQNLGETPGEWRGLIVRNAADFRAKLAEGGLDLVIVDVTARPAEPENLIREARAAGLPVLAFGAHTDPQSLRQARAAGLPVLAFGAHTDPQSLRQARAAGAYRVVPNSMLVAKFPALVAQAFDPSKTIPRDADEPE